MLTVHHLASFANGSMIPSFMVDVVRQSAAAPGGSGALALAGDRTQRALKMIEDRLGRASFFAGEVYRRRHYDVPAALQRDARIRCLSQCCGLPQTLGSAARLQAGDGQGRAGSSGSDLEGKTYASKQS